MAELVPDTSKLQPEGVVEGIYQQMEEDLKTCWGEEEGSLNEEKIERISCTLCGEESPPQERAIFKKFRFPYVRCPSCGLIYPSIRPKRNYIENLYTSGRFAKAHKELYLPSAEYRMKTIFRERVKELIMPRVPKGRLLDIGCSSGHFLKVAHAHGFDVHGMELNPEMVRFATEELGLPNIKADVLTENTYPENYFDVITVWDVLEHVPDPGEILVQAFRTLKPGGWIFGYTENVDSFNVFITDRDSEIFMPDVHLRHYSPETFKKEFEKAGFVVREVMTKGLDVQHIKITLDLNPGKFPEKELQYLLDHSEEWQNVMNACDKGDNLRLFAQKSN